jgi:hypothetical protein
MERTPFSPDLALNNSWLFPKIKFALKRRFQNIKDTQKCDKGTESYSTTEVPKMLPAVGASLG